MKKSEAIVFFAKQVGENAFKGACTPINPLGWKQSRKFRKRERACVHGIRVLAERMERS